MKFVIGFFMAWGNFMVLPCPYKRWDSKLKNMMLSFLPSVGLVIGIVWTLLAMLLGYIHLPDSVSAFILMFYIFAVCGFMHMDGFMDCNDAIMSRRPLEDRQRILKDSTVGAFAVVTVAFLLICWYSAASACIEKGFDFIDLMIIPVVSRGVAGLCVLTYKPIGHSQYVEDHKVSRRNYKISVALQTIIAAAVIAYISFARTGDANAFICAVVTAVAAFTACAYARKQLAGMSGDIAGYTICVSELCGILALAVL